MNPKRQLSPQLLDLLALLAGCLWVLGFAPYDYWPLTTLSLSVFFYCILHCSVRRAAWRGYLFALGLFGLGTSWVYISLHDYGGASVIAGVGLSALFAAFYALFGLLAAYLMAVFRKPSGLSLTLIWPAIWILVEWLRASFIFAFPWLQLSYSLLDSPLAGFIPLIGGYGAGWLAASSAAVLLLVLVHVKRYSGIQHLSLVALLVVVWGIGQQLQSVQWTRQTGEPFTVALLQGNIEQDIKWLPQQSESILRVYLQLSRENWDADLIVWPETAVPSYYHQLQGFYKNLGREAKRHNTDLLIGAPLYDSATQRYFNTVISPSDPVQIYRKRHLVPFGEYLPFQPLSGWIAQFLQMPMSDFSAGSVDQPLLTAVGMPLVTTICYEDSFPLENISGLPQGAYIVNVTNDAWFADSSAPHQHLQKARMRSLEGGRYTLRATNNGVTAVINERGKVVQRIPQFKTAVLKTRVIGMQGTTPYVLLGDLPIVLVLLLLCVAVIVWQRR